MMSMIAVWQRNRVFYKCNQGVGPVTTGRIAGAKAIAPSISLTKLTKEGKCRADRSIRALQTGVPTLGMEAVLEINTTT